jgi:8-oxo-dGTP pyrophosphatase MutT (NUDIX family)
MSAETPLPIRHIARAIVLDPQDRILLIAYTSVHAKGPDGAPLRFWFMPGGGLEPGEDHVTACRRELEEEIGRADATARSTCSASRGTHASAISSSACPTTGSIPAASPRPRTIP